MADAEVAQADWLRRVLGVTLDAGGPSAPEFKRRWQAACKSWEDAAEEVNHQIEALANALRASGDKTLQDIAEFGLNGVTGNHLVRLRAAFMEVERTDGAVPAGLRSSTAALVEDFEDHLRHDKRVALTEANPFKVAVPIQARLIPALNALGTVLARA